MKHCVTLWRGIQDHSEIGPFFFCYFCLSKDELDKLDEIINLSNDIDKGFTMFEIPTLGRVVADSKTEAIEKVKEAVFSDLSERYKEFGKLSKTDRDFLEKMYSEYKHKKNLEEECKQNGYNVDAMYANATWTKFNKVIHFHIDTNTKFYYRGYYLDQIDIKKCSCKDVQKVDRLAEKIEEFELSDKNLPFEPDDIQSDDD